jgi:peptidoglycan hydrolase-like protein with peptidoglycan-binding domain
MALLDLGYSMPRSTGNTKYSPDGIYGEETKAVVKKFQKDRPAKSNAPDVANRTERTGAYESTREPDTKQRLLPNDMIGFDRIRSRRKSRRMRLP